MNNPFNEKTLVIIKPDGVSRMLCGEIIRRIEAVGLKLVDAKMTEADEKLAEQHYPETEEWLSAVGKKGLDDYEKYGFDPVETIGTSDPIEYGKMILKFNKDYLMSGPLLALVFEGNHAVEVVRKLVGHTNPIMAPAGTIRGDLAAESAIIANLEKRSLYNLVHASGSVDEANREIKLWFGK